MVQSPRPGGPRLSVVGPEHLRFGPVFEEHAPRLGGQEPDLIGLGPAGVHPNPMTPEEMFEILVSLRAFTFNRGASTVENPLAVEPRAVGPGGKLSPDLTPGLGAGIGPAAGGRDAGNSVFAVIEIVDSSGRAVIRASGEFVVDSAQEAAVRAEGGSVNRADKLHAEQSALAGLQSRLGDHAPEIEGGQLKVVVDQLPCGPESANCSLALRQFADKYGLTLRVFVPQRPSLNDPNTMVAPRAATMGSQTTGMPPVTVRELGAAELEHGDHNH